MATPNTGYGVSTQQYYGSAPLVSGYRSGGTLGLSGGYGGSSGGYGGSTGGYGGSSGGYAGTSSGYGGSSGGYAGSSGGYAGSFNPSSEGTYDHGQQPSLYQTGTYGALGEPDKLLGSSNRFSSATSKSWQSYGDPPGQYGSSFDRSYASNNDSMNSITDTYTQNNESSYGQNYSQDYGQTYGQYGYSKDEEDTWGDSGKYSSQDWRSGDSLGRGGLRGTSGRGRGRFDRGGRGRANGMRGRGDQVSGTGRGRGYDWGRGMGRGQVDGKRGRGRGREFIQGYTTDWKKSGANKKPTSSKVALEGDKNFISYKNSLQEYCQKQHKAVPQYTVTKVDVGFSAKVQVDGVYYSCETSQRERKFAELGAAFEALKGLGVIKVFEKFSPKGKKRPASDQSAQKSKAPKSESDPVPSTPPVPYKCQLNELCQKMKYTPKYNCVRTAGGFICTVALNGEIYQSTQPCGTKKLAEHNASEVVLAQVDFSAAKSKPSGEPNSNLSNAVITPITQTTTDSDTITSPKTTITTSTTPPSPNKGSTPTAPVQKSMKNIVQEYCQKNGMAIPKYATVKEAGINISTISVNGKEFVGTPHILKKTAEQNAAKKAIEEMGLK